MQEWYLGREKVSCLERCPQFSGTWGGKMCPQCPHREREVPLLYTFHALYTHTTVLTVSVMCAGVRNVPVVKECKCVGGCYRLPHYQEIKVQGVESPRGEEGGSGEVRGEGVSEGSQVQTMVDIGRCSGSCPAPEQRCIP